MSYIIAVPKWKSLKNVIMVIVILLLTYKDSLRTHNILKPFFPEIQKLTFQTGILKMHTNYYAANEMWWLCSEKHKWGAISIWNDCSVAFISSITQIYGGGRGRGREEGRDDRGWRRLYGITVRRTWVWSAAQGVGDGPRRPWRAAVVGSQKSRSAGDWTALNWTVML